ncbi:MAG: restriction endonuclease subunit S [Porphyromonadaceae bacterium]|nr:restriction endonuclease subunit S [Porphyromonadaceae bacterium]
MCKKRLFRPCRRRVRKSSNYEICTLCYIQENRGISLNGEKLLSGLHTLLARPKRNIFFVGFNGYLFKSNFVRSQIQKEAQGIKVSSISVKRISNTELFYPTHQEQTKIASFLSLIDERIQTQMKIL